MTVNLNIQSLSYTASRIQMTVGTSRPPASTAPVARETDDRATLSSGALAPPSTRDTASAEPPASANPAPVEGPSAAPAPPPSRAARRAEALFAALDADQDGSVTKEEFTSGAKALLGRDGGPRRAGDDDDLRRVSRFERRLDRKLAKAFDRVDGDDDGAISEAEMTAAFEKIARRRGGPDGPPQPPAGAPADAAAGGGASVTSIQITYVSIAIQRYTAVQGPTEPQAVRTEASDDTQERRTVAGQGASPAPREAGASGAGTSGLRAA